MSYVCNHCGNTTGFVFGTCTTCGWNNDEGYFKWIKVNIDDLYRNISRLKLIEKHTSSTRKQR